MAISKSQKRKQRVSSTKSFEDNLKKYTDDVKTDARKAETLIALLVKKRSQKNVPVREGNLRAAHHIVFDDGVKDAGGPFKGEGAAKDAADNAIAVVAHVAGAKALALGKGKSAVGIGVGTAYAVAVHETPTAGAIGYALKLAVDDPSVDPIYRRDVVVDGFLIHEEGDRKTADAIHSKVGGWKYMEHAVNNHRGQYRKIYRETVKPKI